jgi:hypothetical protein
MFLGSLDLREFLVGLCLLTDQPDSTGNEPSSRQKSKGSMEAAKLDAAAAEVTRSYTDGYHHDDATLRLAFDMFSVDGEGDVVLLSDLRRVFRRAFPDVADFEVTRVFADTEAAAKAKQEQRISHSKNKALPPKTPRGSDTVCLSFSEFVDFCRAHPECVSKFKSTLKLNKEAQ